MKSLLRFAVALSGSLVATFAAEEPPPLALPKVEVSAKPLVNEKESWRYASFGNFEVLTKATSLSAGGMLTGLQEFDYALRLIFPTLTARSTQPISILLTQEGGYRDFISGPADAPAEFSRYFHGSERSAIVVNMDATEPAFDSLIQLSTVDPFRQLSRQYLRHLFAESGVRLPNWLEEGLAQTIADIEVQGSWLTYGKVVTSKNMPDGEMTEPANPVYDFLAPNTALSGLSFKEAFSHRRFMALDQFFTARLPDGTAPSSDSAWAKQAYAFVHFCLFGNQLRYRAPLMAFVEGLNSEPPSDALFTRCFGVNYEGMRKELWGYLLHTRHQYQRYELKPAERFKAEPITLREADDNEIALIKGEALQLSGNDAAALETYRQTYLRGLRTPDYLAAYAAVCFRRGDRDRANELLKMALEKGTQRPSARVLQARLLLDHYSTASGKSDARLTDAQLAAVLAPLFAARQLKPAIPEVYLLIADAWSRSEETPKPENLAVLDEGIRLFPRQSSLLIRSIDAYRRLGDEDKIASIARLGLRMAVDADARAYFKPLAERATDAAKL